MKTVLYFGNIDLESGRNKVYIQGLRANRFEVLTCVDRGRGLRKYWELYKKHKEVKGKYDVILVGYGGYVTVPLAKLVSNKPVIFDALCSFYETEILSRDALKEVPFRILFVRFVDWVSTRFADKVLVESDKQKEYFNKELGVKSEKLVTVYTGVDDSIFKKDETIKKYEKFTVLFRGRIMSEAGVPTIIRAAKLLEDKDIDFLIIGYGCNKAMKDFNETLEKESPKKLTHVGRRLPFNEMVPLMQKCHISLGQFAKHERLERTVPHKAYESLALGLPYITAREGGIEEILKDGENCLMVEPENCTDLADKILQLYENETFRTSLVKNGEALYLRKFTPKEIVRPLLSLVEQTP